MKRTETISRVLEDLLSSLGLENVRHQVRISRAWPEIVGPLLSGKTSPSRLKFGTLTVLVGNHAWAQELQLQKPALTARVNEALGDTLVKDIRFVTGPLHPEAERAAPRDPPPPDPGHGKDPEGLGSVRDPETREILRAIARRAASRKR